MEPKRNFGKVFKEGKLMVQNTQLILIILNIALFLGGVVLFGALDLTPFSFNIHASIDLIVLTISFFVLSIMFSGLLSPLLFLYYGALSSSLVATNPLGVLLTVVPLMIAAYAGSIAGHFASKDLHEKGNLFEQKKLLLVLFFSSLVFAVIVGFVFEFLSTIDQKSILPV